LRVTLTGLVLSLCLACWAGLARAEIPNELRGQRIIGVRVGGDSAQIAGPEIIGIPPGELLDRSIVRGAIQRLLRSGRWVDVQVEAESATNGVVLVFYLEPRIFVRRIEVRGQEQLDEQMVRDALGVGVGAEVRADAMPALEAGVRRAYAERGYLGTRVSVRFRDTDDPSQRVLLVELYEGGPTRIADLSFRRAGPQSAGATLGKLPQAPANIFSAMGLARGDVLNRRLLTAALRSGERYLHDQQYLEAHIGSPVITVRGESASLTFPLHLGPHYRLQVSGATPLRDTAIAAAALQSEAPLTAELIDAMPERIKDVYRKYGFLHARASVSRKQTAEGEALLSARIDPGAQVEVSLVSFPGAQHFTPAFLHEQLVSYLEEDLPGGSLVETVDSHVTGQLTTGPSLGHAREQPRPEQEQPDRTYYQPTYQAAAKHIAELYQAAGFLAVRVDAPSVRMLDDTHATVNIEIEEGPRTLLHSVVLRGQEQVSAQALLLASGLLRGAPFSYLALEEARVRMQELYQERGYMFVRIEPSVRFSSDRTRAELSVQIVESFPVTVGDVLVQGAERTDQAFIESLVTVKRGDVFRPSKARESERIVASLGAIAGISVQLEEPDLPARVKRVLVVVSERSNQFLDFSAGLSTGQGARFGFDYGYRNLFGRGIGLNLRVQFAYQLLVREELQPTFNSLLFSDRLERNISLGLLVPRTPFLGSTRVNLDLFHVRDNETQFGLDKNGVTLAFTEPLGRVTLLEAVDLEHNNVDVFEDKSLDELIAGTTDPRLQRLLRVPEGNTALVALRVTASYDQRDRPFVPTRGYFISISTELASTLIVARSQDQSRFLKVQLTGSGYVPVWRTVVLAGQLRVGRIMHFTSGPLTYPNRAFYLGGVDTMRGYYQDELIPQDLVDRGGRVVGPRGGDAFVLLRGELRFPIYGQLGGGLFADFGNLWRDANAMNLLALRPTAGAGLRLSTPVGPIAVDYGIVILRREELNEPFGTLHFSIGLF
jgi:outer membrane protein insertion porin family